MMKKHVFLSIQNSQNCFTSLKITIWGCLLDVMDVLSILNWIETLYMSLQYIFNANKAPFISSTFMWLFDSSTPQCSPDECTLYVMTIYEDKSKVGCGLWSIFAILLFFCLLPCHMPFFFMSTHYLLRLGVKIYGFPWRLLLFFCLHLGNLSCYFSAHLCNQSWYLDDVKSIVLSLGPTTNLTLIPVYHHQEA